MLRVLVVVLLASDSQQSVVHTAQGRVVGAENEGVVSYRGIPYGSIREDGQFKQAGLAPSWVDDRGSEQASCSATSVEACLQLDVHVPGGGGAPWPVLAWVAGAGGSYRPAQLVRQGVVVVVVHHRLGPMGFVCTKEEQIPGNAGAKDVVSALRWVRDNIVAFRGNPAQVVVGGQGLAAAVVEGLLLSPMAEGLLHGAIMQSGTILTPWAFNYDATERALALANMFSDSDDVLSLLNSDSTDLVNKADQLNLPYYPFGMCVEKAFKREERFLSEPPFDSMSRHKLRRVPLLIGFNSDEGYVFAALLNRQRILKRIIKHFNILLPEELKNLNDRELKQIKDMYFNGKVNMSNVLAYHRDAYFVSHVHRSARLHAAASPLPVYYYQFSHSGAWGVQPEPGTPKAGAAHSDELALLFPERGQELDGEDGDAQRTMIRLWTNFVKYLEPTRASDSPRWEAAGARADNLLDIGTSASMRAFPYERAARLWGDLYERHYYNKHRNT